MRIDPVEAAEKAASLQNIIQRGKEEQPGPMKGVKPLDRAGVMPSEGVTPPQQAAKTPDGRIPFTEGRVRGADYDEEVKDMKRMGAIRCATCENRKYQDGSNDPGVSFQSPQRISPQASVGKVRSHENEHVRRESAKAGREDREVVSQSVSIHMSTCPECGRSYASGGVTKTVTRADNNDNAFMKDMKDFMAGHFGNYMDAQSR